MQLYQPLDGYCFNSDTLFLYDFIRRFSLGKELLEVGSGSGVLGLLLKRDCDINLTQVEKQEDFIWFSKHNARANHLESKVFHSDFLTFTSDKKYDTIVSNPPFYHDDVVKSENSMRHTARYIEHLPIEAFITKASKLLTPRGRFIFCYDPQMLPDLMVSLMDAKFRVEDIRYVHPKETKKASLVMLHARKSSKAKTTIHPPLFGFEGEAHSKEAQRIYAMCKTHSIKCERGEM